MWSRKSLILGKDIKLFVFNYLDVIIYEWNSENLLDIFIRDINPSFQELTASFAWLHLHRMAFVDQ